MLLLYNNGVFTIPKNHNIINDFDYDHVLRKTSTLLGQTEQTENGGLSNEEKFSNFTNEIQEPITFSEFPNLKKVIIKKS